jgi:DNA-binding winged helix-turn-helix (wHTH) protein
MQCKDAGVRCLDFVTFEVDVARGEIRRDGRIIRLRPKSWHVLEYFLAHRGRVLTRHEIIDAVWGPVVVTEDSLTQCIADIRRALRDDHRVTVRTVARRGYLFDLEPRRDAVGTSVDMRPVAQPASGEARPSAPHSSGAERSAVLGVTGVLRRAPDDLAVAEQHLERAVALDPGHARAWTTLAGVYAARAAEDLGDTRYRIDARERALARALSLDPRSGEAHVRMGRLHEDAGRAEAARASFETAYELDLDDPTVLSTLSVRALLGGRSQEAVELARRGVEAEPLSAVRRMTYGRLLLVTGAGERARDQLSFALQLSPRLLELHGDIARSYLIDGRFAEARSALQSVPAGLIRAQLQVLLGAAEDAASGDGSLQADSSWLAPLLRAEVASFRGDADAAFILLNEAKARWSAARIGRPTTFAIELAISPFLRSLHGDERWPALLQTVPTSLI